MGYYIREKEGTEGKHFQIMDREKKGDIGKVIMDIYDLDEFIDFHSSGATEILELGQDGKSVYFKEDGPIDESIFSMEQERNRIRFIDRKWINAQKK